MNHELAKQLKDAGFPQSFGNGLTNIHNPDFENRRKMNGGETLSECHDTECPFAYGKRPENLKVGDHNQKLIHHRINHLSYAPTLSELIEACGEYFRTLWFEKGTWMASAVMDNDARNKSLYTPSDVYKTPEEAVAHLWLALKAHGKA